jgi:hypothetical protein
MGPPRPRNAGDQPLETIEGWLFRAINDAFGQLGQPMRKTVYTSIPFGSQARLQTQKLEEPYTADKFRTILPMAPMNESGDADEKLFARAMFKLRFVNSNRKLEVFLQGEGCAVMESLRGVRAVPDHFQDEDSEKLKTRLAELVGLPLENLFYLQADDSHFGRDLPNDCNAVAPKDK